MRKQSTEWEEIGYGQVSRQVKKWPKNWFDQIFAMTYFSTGVKQATANN